MRSQRPSGDTPNPRPVLLARRLVHQRIHGGIGAEYDERTRRDDSVPRPSVRRRERDNGCSRNRCRRGARRGRPTGSGESAREGVARIGLEKMQDALLAAVLGESVGQQSPILARDSTSRGRSLRPRRELLGSTSDMIATVDPLPHVQHGLVLAAVTSLVEVPTSDGDRHADGADRRATARVAHGSSSARPGAAR